MDTFTLSLLCTAAFTAGFVDAIVGGGGLIQTPSALVLLPRLPVSHVIASIKIPSFTGTAFAAAQYLRRVQVVWKQAVIMCITAFIAAFAGSALLTHVSNAFMKPVIFIILVVVTIYTFLKKDFGQQHKRKLSSRQFTWYSIGISLVIGFYDGFIGPGAGSFVILSYIALLGFDFLHASAYAKLVNMSTNLGSIVLFLWKGGIVWMVTIPMAISNALGAIIGARLALSEGNRFIRAFFLLVVCCTLLRFGYDIFFNS